MELSVDFKQKVVKAIQERRAIFGGSDSSFAKSIGIRHSIYSRIKGGYKEQLIGDAKWMTIARWLDVKPDEKAWNIVRTDVLVKIEKEVLFCKENAKSRIFCDDCEIGKTEALKYLAKTLPNCFRIDASQAKGKRLFFREFAQAIGCETNGTYNDIKSAIKYALRALQKPMILIDEAGDLEYEAFLDIKEIWNAVEGYCGWYMVGADGLRAKINDGIRRNKVGFAEMYSRFSRSYSSIVPVGKDDRTLFYRKLVRDVLGNNLDGCGTNLDTLVNQCLKDGEGGLRRAGAILHLNKN